MHSKVRAQNKKEAEQLLYDLKAVELGGYNHFMEKEIYEQGSVHGNIRAPYVVLEGELKGNIISAKQVELRSPARMNGRIETDLLAVAEGCILEGKVDMLKADAQPIHFTEKRQPFPAETGPDQDT